MGGGVSKPRHNPEFDGWKDGSESLEETNVNEIKALKETESHRASDELRTVKFPGFE